MQETWQPELARGLFVIGGAVIAFGGVMFSQRRQERRDRINDARVLRDSKRARLEAAYIPVLLCARAMWELVLRHGKKSEDVSTKEERDYLCRLWQRATADVEESLVRLSMEIEPGAPTANSIFDHMRSEFYAYLAYLKEAPAPGDFKPELVDNVLSSRQAVHSLLVELEDLSRQQLQQLAQPLFMDRTPRYSHFFKNIPTHRLPGSREKG